MEPGPGEGCIPFFLPVIVRAVSVDAGFFSQQVPLFSVAEQKQIALIFR